MTLKTVHNAGSQFLAAHSDSRTREAQHYWFDQREAYYKNLQRLRKTMLFKKLDV